MSNEKDEGVDQQESIMGDIIEDNLPTSISQLHQNDKEETENKPPIVIETPTLVINEEAKKQSNGDILKSESSVGEKLTYEKAESSPVTVEQEVEIKKDIREAGKDLDEEISSIPDNKSCLEKPGKICKDESDVAAAMELEDSTTVEASDSERKTSLIIEKTQDESIGRVTVPKSEKEEDKMKPCINCSNSYRI